jgi:hypothetical protein
VHACAALVTSLQLTFQLFVGMRARVRTCGARVRDSFAIDFSAVLVALRGGQHSLIPGIAR